MDASAVAERYFEAWNRRDPEAIAAVFAEGGTYADPNVPDGIGAEATAQYAGGLFAGFPDLAFQIESLGVRPDGSVAAQWLMTGTNAGPYQGLPPSGREVRLPGADVITVEGDRVRSVVGYFDTAVVPRQLGLQVVVQPDRIGPFVFGTSTYVSTDGREPGAMSLTVLEARSPEEIQEVRSRTREVISDLMGTPGFISWVGVVVGTRMFTITAWDGPGDVARLSESPAQPRPCGRSSPRTPAASPRAARPASGSPTASTASGCAARPAAGWRGRGPTAAARAAPSRRSRATGSGPLSPGVVGRLGDDVERAVRVHEVERAAHRPVACAERDPASGPLGVVAGAEEGPDAVGVDELQLTQVDEHRVRSRVAGEPRQQAVDGLGIRQVQITRQHHAPAGRLHELHFDVVEGVRHVRSHGRGGTEPDHPTGPASATRHIASSPGQPLQKG